MKTLYVNGCSFTIGAELSHPQELCYATILGSNDLLCLFNDDGVINIIDIVIMVNIILEGDE